jgi:hypothetical protein
MLRVCELLNVGTKKVNEEKKRKAKEVDERFLNHVGDDAVVLFRPLVEDSVLVGSEERYSEFDQTRETCKVKSSCQSLLKK